MRRKANGAERFELPFDDIDERQSGGGSFLSPNGAAREPLSGGWNYSSRILRPENFEESKLEVPWGPQVCGVDEAGRGPLAGPVAAAAVVLPADFPRGELDDSKAMSPAGRLRAYETIVSLAIDWSVAWATFEEIGEFNILRASLLAMARAVHFLQAPIGLVAVDGNRLPSLKPRNLSGVNGPLVVGIVKGDAVVPAIMAASILAKVARDELMRMLDAVQPEYGFATHKGYPTANHTAALLKHGPSLWQRRGFTY